jgi:hypothetical protein
VKKLNELHSNRSCQSIYDFSVFEANSIQNDRHCMNLVDRSCDLAQDLQVTYTAFRSFPSHETASSDDSHSTLISDSPPGSGTVDLRSNLDVKPSKRQGKWPSRDSWTEDEDRALAMAVHHLGTHRWADIAKFIPTRTNKQCRDRWFGRLSPHLKKGPFEPWEDQLIVYKQKELGNRWAIIAEFLPGRSSENVKNRWHAGLKTARRMEEEMIAQTLAASQMMNDPGYPSPFAQRDSERLQFEATFQ